MLLPLTTTVAFCSQESPKIPLIIEKLSPEIRQQAINDNGLKCVVNTTTLATIISDGTQIIYTPTTGAGTFTAFHHETPVLFTRNSALADGTSEEVKIEAITQQHAPEQEGKMPNIHFHPYYPNANSDTESEQIPKPICTLCIFTWRKDPTTRATPSLPLYAAFLIQHGSQTGSAPHTIQHLTGRFYINPTIAQRAKEIIGKETAALETAQQGSRTKGS